MAKVHKAHKSTKKYSFQKKHISMKTLLIILAVIVVAGIGLKVAYDNYVYDEFDVPAPTAEQLNNIADNWEVLNTHTDKFYNYYDMYYSLMGYETDGTDGYGNVVLVYTAREDLDEVSVMITPDAEGAEVTTFGGVARTSLTDFINGVAPWGQETKQVSAANNRCSVVVYDTDAKELDSAILAEIIAEIEAVIVEGPMVAEETTEEVPAE